MPNVIDLCAIADLKLWLGIDAGSSKDDALLADLITRVSREILTRINRDSILSATYAENYDGSGTPQQALLHFPIISVSSLKINGVAIALSPDGVQAGFTFSNYVLKLIAATSSTPIPSGPSYGVPSVFSRGFQNVAVSYQAGYVGVPGDLSEAAKELCAFRYRQRSWIGQTSKHLGTGETVSFSQASMPAAVKEVLAQYTRRVPV